MRFEGRLAVLGVAGEVDLATVDELVAAMRRCLTDDRVSGLVVRLDEVTFLDCAGISALLTARRAALGTGRRFHVAGARGQVRRVLCLTGTLEPLAGGPAPARGGRQRQPKTWV
ncbi:hypothetical protein Sya03_43200 [Spirilliplanes yamanashiensis]|uniref:STAS domain-containing protein n=1 Tax=Spirilliplanes yamanashiensis TaxID=42233 RepID=A0A8J3YAK6_9ACTN|nr:hypothetical protein Sya03_43200 [Spirilliplanes yamanashiensis]